MVEFLLDTIDLNLVKKYIPTIQVSGLTSTPSIIKREGKIDLVSHMKETLEILGPNRTLHMQMVGRTQTQLVKDAQFVWREISPAIYAKIPTIEAGFQAIHHLKQENPNCRITATAVYSKMQAFLAIDAKADYIAIYTDRSENVGVNPFDIITSSRNYVDRTGSKTKIMASSIKNLQQITDAIDAGADAVTFATGILAKSFANASVKQAVDAFTEDWIELYGREELY